MTTHLVAASHGTRSADGQAAIAALVADVRRRLPATSVHDAFVDVQEPGPGMVLRRLGEQPATIVPLLLAPGFHVHHDLAIAARRPGTRVAGCLGPDARLTAVLLDRLVETGLRPSDEIVLAVAGSSDDRAHRAVEAQGRLLAARLGRAVAIGHLGGSGRPLGEVVAHARRGAGRVVVASFLMAPGFFHDLARGCGADAVSAPLLTPTSVPGELTEIVVDRFRAAPADAEDRPSGRRRRVGVQMSHGPVGQDTSS